MKTNNMTLPASCTALTEDEGRNICGGTTEVFGMEFDDTSDAVISIGGIALVAIVGFNLLKSVWNNFLLPSFQNTVSNSGSFNG